MPPSPPTAEDAAFIHALPFSTIQKFRAETFHPQFIQDSPGHFKDLDYINVPQLRAYVERRRIEPAVATRDAFTAKDGLPTLPHGILWEYRNTIYHPNHIAAFAHRFLDTKWIDPAHLLTFLENTHRLEERMSLQPPPIQFKDIRNIVGMPESPPYDAPGSYEPQHRRPLQAAPDAERCIYVPDDPAIRMAMVLHTPEKPHTHILAAFTKKTIELTTAYEDCIVASGTVGATVGKVDKAPSTSLILDGKTPAQFAPALQSKVLKAKILREVKTKSFPAGLGIEGVFHLYRQELKSPVKERYIHRCCVSEAGTMIVTAVPDLLKLLDDAGVNSFEGDFTYKRVSGDLNEWEGVIYYKPLERGMSSSPLPSQSHRGMFDQIREVKVAVTGKPIAFERLVPGGNLIAFNSDMDSAQVLGFSRSLIKTNVPEHSGIPANIKPQEFAPYIIKLCITHAKRAILDFRSLVNDQDYHRLLNFATEITSEETLAGFREFVYALGIPKITQWFDHKDLNAWTLRCLCKGRSQLTAEQWDSTPSTTNTGEAQHHWTNTQTGIKLPLVEAIETARKLDLAVLSEVQLAFESGILTNPHNELAKRTARKLTRHAATARKYRETRAAAQAADLLDADIAEAARQQKEAAERLKDLRAQKSAGKSKGKGTGTGGRRIAGESSSGRVRGSKPAHSVVVAAIATAPAQAILSAPHPASGATPLQNNDSPAPDAPMPSLNNLTEYVDTDVAFTAAELALFEQQGLDLGGDGLASDTFSLEAFSGSFSDEAFSDDVFSGDALNAFFGDAFSSDATLVDITNTHVLDDRAYAALLGASTKAGDGGALSEDADTLPRLPPPPRRSPSPSSG
ncbi:hypothetical protein MKEN_00954600 [Mycena kentingensis (nom. inval.)]|nr:hypothetical protein MKEN_00954600 [Mycena kentingensis (nom. inval.)]